MEFKQMSPDIVIRSSTGEVIDVNDAEYIAWLENGNSPFPPDPPVGEELEQIVNELSVEE
jgi:hypothetical protein